MLTFAFSEKTIHPMTRIIICITLLLIFLDVHAQYVVPEINPTATYTNSKGEEETSEEYSGPAPLKALFQANPSNTDGWTEYYEWRFTKEGESEALEPYLIRYEQDTEFTFTDSGSHRIVCYAVFTQGKDTIAYTDDYWSDAEPLRVTISESKLDMPNAFSPNGDGINDIYQAKTGYQSLVEFHAIIFNRWGQKIYEWDDPAGGWDGTHHGQPARQGVYFVDVKAKGADGRSYHIRRDVNLLRGYTDKESSPSTDN